MHNYPRIAVPSFRIQERHYEEPGYPRMTLNEDYPRSLQAAGAAPFLLAVSEDFRYLEEQLALMDGLILPGGNDLSPLLYGEDPTTSESTDPLRDAFEWELIRIAMARKKPILGICRGIQILNVYFGGTLHQDLKTDGYSIKHVQEPPMGIVSHLVQVEPESWLGRIVATRPQHSATPYPAVPGKVPEDPYTLEVNSFHHQAIKDLAPFFRPMAHSRDGLVEAVEAADGSPVYGIQWHPEML